MLLALSAPAGAGQGDCSQPLTTGARPAASDCLYILRVAVGSQTCEPECICAPRGMGSATATDALLCLKFAVGGDVPLDCACTTTTTSSSTTTTTTITLDLPADWEEPFDASEIGWMMSAWGPGSGVLWAVGGGFFDGRIFRHGAGGWAEVDHGFDVPLLTWGHGTGPNDVFAGGYGGTVLHFDGQTWTQQATPVTDPVWGVWAVAPDDVWAVGGEVLSSTPPFVMRYDGQTWSLVDLPVLVRPGVHALFKIWASADDDLYIVGQNGIALHWNGESLTELFLGVSQDLIGIWGTSADNIVAVGGRGTAEIVRWDGETWTKKEGSSLPGLNGVWLGRPDVAHAVGVAGTSVLVDPETLAITDDPVSTDLELHGIFADARGQLIALGANFVFPEEGVVLIRELGDDE